MEFLAMALSFTPKILGVCQSGWLRGAAGFSNCSLESDSLALFYRFSAGFVSVALDFIANYWLKFGACEWSANK